MKTERELMADAVEELLERKEKYVLAEFKKLLVTGAVWLENDKNIEIRTFWHKHRDTEITMKQGWRFVFDPIKRVTDLQKEGELMKDRIKELEDVLNAVRSESLRASRDCLRCRIATEVLR